MIDERIKIDTTSQGYPVLVRAGNHKIEVVISEVSGTTLIDVEISGDSPSLRRLGEVLIGVSYAKGHHVHLESNPEVSAIDIKPSNIRFLTIENIEKPPPEPERTSPPPDWARG